MGAKRLLPPRGSVVCMHGRVYAWTCGRVDASTAPFFLLLFVLLDKSLKLSKILSVLRSASVQRFDVSRMRDFFLVCVYS